MARPGEGPRRRRMIRGTIARIGELAMRYGFPSQLATLDCTSSRRSTVMCALPRAIAVTTVYQRDSSPKRPRSSVVSAARAPSCLGNTTWRTRHPGLLALRAAPAAPLDTALATWTEALMPATNACWLSPSHHRKIGGLTRGHSISASGQRVAYRLGPGAHSHGHVRRLPWNSHGVDCHRPATPLWTICDRRRRNHRQRFVR